MAYDNEFGKGDHQHLDEIATAGLCARTVARALTEMASGISVALGSCP